MSTTPSTKSSVKTAPLHQHDDGTICALGSDGRTHYTVRLNPENCTCAGYRHYGRCYHLSTAKARFGTFYAAPWANRRPAARISDLYAEAAG